MDPVEALRRDRAHGAAELLEMALDALAHAVRNGEPLEPLATRLAEARPGMVPIGTGVRLARERYRADPTPEALLAVRDEAREARREAAHAAAELLRGQRVVTLSRSSTVHAALVEARATVAVLASDPLGEGRAAVADLRTAGIDARVVPDASARAALQDADACLVGADAVLADGSLLNKVGSWTLAACARDAGVPFLAVADRFKRTDEAMVPHDADLLEMVPVRLVTRILP